MFRRADDQISQGDIKAFVQLIKKLEKKENILTRVKEKDCVSPAGKIVPSKL